MVRRRPPSAHHPGPAGQPIAPTTGVGPVGAGATPPAGGVAGGSCDGAGSPSATSAGASLVQPVPDDVSPAPTLDGTAVGAWRNGHGMSRVRVPVAGTGRPSPSGYSTSSSATARSG